MRYASSREEGRKARAWFWAGSGLVALVVLGVLSGHIWRRQPFPARVAPQEVHQDKVPVAPGARAAPTGETREAAAEAPVQTTVLPGATGDDVALPAPPLDEKQVNLQLAELRMEQFWKREDRVARSWPRLDDLREQLVPQVRAEFDWEKMTVPELVQHAIALREKFWQAGGRTSPDSFLDLYRARVLLELGRQRYPDDLALTDELVETIQSGWPYQTYGSPPPQAFVSVDKDGKPLEPGSVMAFDRTTMREVLELREKQFEIRKRQFQENRPPEFQDFLRLYDLGVLYQCTPGVQRQASAARAGQLVKWLLDNADQGGWAYYRAHLERLAESWANGKSYAFTIFIPRNRQVEPAAPYARRLPSFRGAQGRDLIAMKDLLPGTNVVHVRNRPGGDGLVEIVEQ